MPQGFYDVTLTVTSQTGCDNDSVADGYVWVLPLPEVNFIANPWVTRVPTRKFRSRHRRRLQ